jgi:hypothetical protein
MTTYATYTNGGSIPNRGGANAAGVPAVTVITNVFDAAERNVTAADVVQLLTIPARTMVHGVQYQVLTGEAAQTMSLGHGGAATQYASAVDVATTGNTACSAGTTEIYYSAADTIDITVPSLKAYTTLKVRVSAICTMFG